MKEREPRYVGISLSALKTLAIFGDAEQRNAFVLWLYQAYQDMRAGKALSVPENGGLAFTEAVKASIPETETVYRVYLQRQSGNKPAADQRSTNGEPLGIPITEQQEEYIKKKNPVRQSRGPEPWEVNKLLIEDHFSVEEIQEALEAIKGRTDIKNYYGYLKDIIQRKKGMK